MIDTMASAAMRRVTSTINRSYGQHLRAMREHAEEYERNQALAPVDIAQTAINSVAPTSAEVLDMCMQSDAAYKYVQWLCAAAGVDYPPKQD